MSEETIAKGPLSGIRVLDFSMFMAGPYASRLLADAGAEVIKVEPPEGDYMRKSNPLRGDHSGFFGHLNCGKKCLTLNLKDDNDRAVINALMPSVDVVLENFRPGVTKRLGLHYDDLSAMRPGLVYCSVSGYGQTGPAAQLPAYAPVLHAASGFDLAQIEYDPRQEQPIPNRSTTADILAATHAFGAICAALVNRQNTGIGEHIDVALMDVMHQMLGYEVQTAQIETVPAPVIFEPIKTQDGFIMVAPISQLNFEALADGTGHPEWKDDARFSSPIPRSRHWAELMAEIANWANGRLAEDCIDDLVKTGCPCTRYMTVAESMAQPQVAHRGSMAEVEDGWGRYKVPNSPFVFANAHVQARPWIAEQGQHTNEILAELGLDEKTARG
ncbi:MAG: CoA transferase [Rhodospirillaceae bacterium]|jgi:CoA:oxalate CoA-transferase|nr:CoA transferase [Rhodospirillaceae bacterium]MBT5193372.1 CoA transferase [Rhodospirillaceae bacterium]MBT5895245.1 CoA transferase [Rhodospirillaceae bacterium]MBT6430888.1 CoA transferase [Rhodospirillaceae bacterium]